jgi:hypothetical protein
MVSHKVSILKEQAKQQAIKLGLMCKEKCKHRFKCRTAPNIALRMKRKALLSNVLHMLNTKINISMRTIENIIKFFGDQSIAIIEPLTTNGYKIDYKLIGIFLKYNIIISNIDRIGLNYGKELYMECFKNNNYPKEWVFDPKEIDIVQHKYRQLFLTNRIKTSIVYKEANPTVIFDKFCYENLYLMGKSNKMKQLYGDHEISVYSLRSMQYDMMFRRSRWRPGRLASDASQKQLIYEYMSKLEDDKITYEYMSKELTARQT